MKNTYKFDFAKNEFVFTGGDCKVLSGDDALKMWIEKILHTQLGAYKMYKTYGSNIQDLVIGSEYNREFAEAELKREIGEALLKNGDITSVNNIIISRNRKTLDVQVEITTIYGTRSEVYSI